MPLGSKPTRLEGSFRLGEDLELDLRAYELRRSGRPLRLERIPMELLLLLVERRGELVTREEIIARIWGQGVFLDADNSINAAIRKIRQVIRDDPQKPTFILTVTGKGYRFVAPVVEAGAPPGSQEMQARPAVSSPGGASSPTVTPPGARRAKRWRVLGPALFFVVTALVAGGFRYRARMADRLTEKDTIVIADFANSTGDAVFDDTLKQGLNASLHQSPFLTILSDDKVTANLKLMTRPENSTLSPEVAREVCQRAGSKAYVAGAIATLGSEYVLGLKAVSCGSGDVLAREQVTVAKKENVIAALGEAASRLRGELGESLASVQKYDVPLEEATTPSLEALKAFTLAYAEANRGAYQAAVPFYQRAIELDPDFAVAHAHMGQAYANGGHTELAVESVKKAFDRRARASDLEKFYIETRYYELVTGDTEKRIESLRFWQKMYPRDPIPINDLASEYNDMGKYTEGLEEAQRMVELAPQHFTGHVLLGIAYMGLGRFAEAKAVREKQVALKLADEWDHADLYGLAFLENDAAAMQREISFSHGQHDEYIMDRTIAGRAASLGKLRAAEETYREAIASAKRNGFASSAKSSAVDLDFIQLMMGKARQLSPETQAVASSAGDERKPAMVGLLYAMRGDPARAGIIADGLLKRFPTATYVKNVWVPCIRAEIEISRGNPGKAIEWLQAATPYEFGWKAQFWPSYIRGRAYLSAHRGNEAAAEFQRILDHRGVTLGGSLAPLVYALSQLQLARARALAGDNAGARSSYQEFLKLWQAADSDVPLLQQAKGELAKLP